MADIRGMPLLSGPAPPTESSQESCRKCNKEFNVIFARSRKCQHCGCLYCHSCSDYQALMPRSGNESGYDPVNVCGYCIDHLSITAAGKGQLKGLPLARLKRYANAYNIAITGAVEKDDIIDALVSARSPNGCLAPAKERYYRTNSIPPRSGQPRGLFSRGDRPHPPNPPPVPPRPPPSQNFPRPDLAPDPPPTPPRPTPRPTQQQSPPPPPPRPNTSSSFFSSTHSTSHTHTTNSNTPPQPPPRPQSNYSSYHNHSSHSFPSQGPYHHQQPAASRSSSNIPNPNANTGGHTHSSPNNTPPRPRATSTAARPQPTSPPQPPQPPQPQAPAPTLDELLNMSAATISQLSISALKSILFTNHINAGQVLEKSDLVKKVIDLLEEERRHRERHRLMEEQEEREQIERQRAMLDEIRREREAREGTAAASAESTTTATETTMEDVAMDSGVTEDSTATATTEEKKIPPKASSGPSPSKLPTSERSGLCVICQDDEANIAIVDCGHMAMCMDCSELVMSSSRECPLCRTRIVTEQRLLRIFKT